MEILRSGSIQCDSDLEGPSASIVVEKRLWSCSVCASVVGLHFFAFFCIYLHLFAFFCIAFFVISICIFFPPLDQGARYFACDSSQEIPNIPVPCFPYHCKKAPSLMTS